MQEKNQTPGSEPFVMFFIGIFGIQQNQKLLGTYNNIICPDCGKFTMLDIFKTYTYFHVFFIPTFRWNTRYYVKTNCCNTIYQLDQDIGRRYEKGENPDIKNEHLRPINQQFSYKTCFNCGARVEQGFNFCPYCGNRL